PPILKMAERPDWTLFRTVEGLAQKAGVPPRLLRRLALKELADNALDAGGSQIDAGTDGTSFFIADDGPGIDGTPEEIASLFSIARPLRSSKLLRLPQRGALGNGLRVVAGAVLASGGSLAVITRNQRIELRPETDGSTTIIKIAPAERPLGTRVEIAFGPTLPADTFALAWVEAARQMAKGEGYPGKSSAFWYDQVQFHELVLAHGVQPLRSLVAQLDGCTGGKPGEIIAAAGLERMSCASVSREQAAKLLQIARKHVRPVSAERLGSVGRDALIAHQYAVEHCSGSFRSAQPRSAIPFVVEAWARKGGHLPLRMLGNRTPVTGEVDVYRRSDKKISLRGCGLSHFLPDVPTTGNYEITVNVLTPYCPMTSDGKAPDFEPFVEAIADAVTKVLRKAQRA